MHYVEVYLRNVKGRFTWHSEELLNAGDRVIVPFRNRSKVGIVLSVSAEKPDFDTVAVQTVWDKGFVDPTALELAGEIADNNFCEVEKVLSLMIPEVFLQKREPAKRLVTYKLINEEVLVRGPKQKKLIEALKNAKGLLSEADCREVVSLATLKSLEEAEIIKKELGLFKVPTTLHKLETKPLLKLTPDQETAYKTITDFEKPSLLWGVTGSGKTEVYKHLAKKALESGKQTLFLLPEIALTPQLIAEFKGVFGDDLAVWHSKLSAGEKTQEWARVQAGQAKILIGTRSAILVPMPDLGLIILDEEHEWTYKNEFAPRFLTHDVAQILAEKNQAQLVLGSATPRLDSLTKVETGEWCLASLPNQVFETASAKVSIIDLKNETKKGNYGPISEGLATALRDIFKAGKQAVLFLNKRGVAGAAMCRHCGDTFDCPNCSAHMKVHGYENPKLICHICGHLESFPSHCTGCKKDDFKFQGWGTEQVEKWLLDNFPDIKVLRADRDTITGKKDFENMTQAFRDHEADVLLGTQMVAKGLDFAKVDLVGIILADVGLNLPDFRAEERVFQILTQVAGRAGRRDTPGQILVQTFRPEEEIFTYLQNKDVAGFLKAQKQNRQALHWPPYGHLAKLSILHPSKGTAFADTKNLFEKLKAQIDTKKRDIEIFWVPAFMPRAHGKYRFHIILKSTDKQAILDTLKSTDLSGATVDIGPESLL